MLHESKINFKKKKSQSVIEYYKTAQSDQLEFAPKQKKSMTNN